jgi:hypothetical protein
MLNEDVVKGDFMDKFNSSDASGNNGGTFIDGVYIHPALLDLLSRPVNITINLNNPGSLIKFTKLGEAMHCSVGNGFVEGEMDEVEAVHEQMWKELYELISTKIPNCKPKTAILKMMESLEETFLGEEDE